MARSSPNRTTAKQKNAGTTVLLVRHGKTPTTGAILPGRAKGLHLSETGREQAVAVAKRIASSMSDIAAIYTSPLERCRETAAPLAAELGIKLQPHKGLIECDFGDWTGKELTKLAKLPEWQIVQRTPSAFRFPNGESFLEMQARIVETVSSLAVEHRGKTVVAYSHADPIKALLINALGSPLDMFQRINVSPCSVSVLHYPHSTSELSYGAFAPTVLTVNSLDDIGGLKPS
jgi:probable phosphomutase (TIGR03848 family)